MYFNIQLVVHVRVSRGESPEVFQKAVCKYYVLLVCGVENVLNMDMGQSTIAQVLMDESLCEFDAMHHTSLLIEKGVAKLFENMLVIFICCDVVHTDKDIKEFQMGK